MLKISIPKYCQMEQRYILDVMLGEFLGLNFELLESDESILKITKAGDVGSGKCLSFNSCFFEKAQNSWLQSETMPILPLSEWEPLKDGIIINKIEQTIPVIYGEPGIAKLNGHWHLNIDIFGSAFFMLSRYEELITSELDNHDRFPATSSIAFKAGFLDRPIVNEYLEILWECLQSLWPELKRKKQKFRKLISCDVDHPFDLAGYSLKKTILRVGARLIRDRNPKLALSDGLNYIFKKFRSDRFDQYRNQIDWIMKLNAKAGNKVAFYFIPIQTNINKEDPNNLLNSKLSNLLAHIVKSGHEVGFHPGYDTYNSPNNFQLSSNELKAAFKKENIDFLNVGGRQHYLRYNVATTPRLWENNGFSYDTSLSFADKAGFRTGVCYEYSMFDLKKRMKMKLKQRPLIVMECSIVAEGYESLGYSEDAVQRFFYFANICRVFNGDFTLLWHNSYFHHKKSKKIYGKLIEKA